ncbi:MAG TPA: hypothetical protein VGP43_04030 [Chitinophagaceae bacterium]|nr:hypothetical protein [Chitinophagaceae bacterium]
MEMTFEMAEEADIILNTVIEKGSADFYWYDTTIFNHHPKHYTNTLFILMNSIEENVVGKSVHGYSIVETYKTRTFLHKGGFKFLHQTQAQIQEKAAEKEKLNLEKLKYDVKNSKRIFRTYWWTFCISIAGFLLALGKIIYDLLQKQ